MVPAPTFTLGTIVRTLSPSRLIVALFGFVTLPVRAVAVRPTTFAHTVDAADWSAAMACGWTLSGAAVQPAFEMSAAQLPELSVVAVPSQNLTPVSCPAAP